MGYVVVELNDRVQATARNGELLFCEPGATRSLAMASADCAGRSLPSIVAVLSGEEASAGGRANLVTEIRNRLEEAALSQDDRVWIAVPARSEPAGLAA